MSSSLHVRNFSAIQGRRERGDAETVKDIVDGKVGCSRAYALPTRLNSCARRSPFFSSVVYEVVSIFAGSGMMPKLALERFFVVLESILICRDADLGMGEGREAG